MQNKPTNKDLFSLIQTQFTKTEERFDRMDNRLDTVDHRLDSVDQRFDIIDERLDSIDERFDTVGKRFDIVDERFANFQEQFELVECRIDDIYGVLGSHASRFDRIEKTMATRHYIDYKIADLKGEYITITKKIVSTLEQKHIFSAEEVSFIFLN